MARRSREEGKGHSPEPMARKLREVDAMLSARSLSAKCYRNSA